MSSICTRYGKDLDVNNCDVISNEVSIIEPAILEIAQVNTTDIRCLGEKGAIEVVATGGTAPYTFEYAIDKATTF
ncbi:MAG: SprB repeat-containing protein [Bacteroidota bacterium]|nr:SprB repeat-containing protein [Bacteroidota bacterium]MDQ3534655.1 SprB repeat-containing protein [Bacteroidota bacterium]